MLLVCAAKRIMGAPPFACLQTRAIGLIAVDILAVSSRLCGLPSACVRRRERGRGILLVKGMYRTLVWEHETQAETDGGIRLNVRSVAGSVDVRLSIMAAETR